MRTKPSAWCGRSRWVANPLNRHLFRAKRAYNKMRQAAWDRHSRPGHACKRGRGHADLPF